MKKLLLSLALVVLSFGFAQAALEMRIDTIAQTISFSGYDTGNAEYDDFLGDYDLRFWTPPEGSNVDSNESINLATLIYSDASYIGLTSYYAALDGSNYIDIDAYGSSDITSLTAVPSATASYAAWAPAHKTQLEGFIGQSMTLVNGTGYSSISIVPEPSSISLALVSVAGLSLVFRCRKHRK